MASGSAAKPTPPKSTERSNRKIPVTRFSLVPAGTATRTVDPSFTPFLLAQPSSTVKSSGPVTSRPATIE
jgi:hypothetical protein